MREVRGTVIMGFRRLDAGSRICLLDAYGEAEARKDAALSEKGRRLGIRSDGQKGNREIMTKKTSVFVRCKVFQGIFDNELYVIVDKSSAYVDRGSVKLLSVLGEKGAQGEVLAYIIQESEDKALVELPGEPVVGGLRSWVPRSQLVAG